jgi:glycosyltransferase involved in cell wall biosynthesis
MVQAMDAIANKSIFISIDGMCDPLGQSQVIPYLAGLADKGFHIRIVSCEKPENFKKNSEFVKKLLGKHKISWSYCFYKTRVPLLSQRGNFRHLKKLTEEELKKSPQGTLLHCRSYLPGLIGLQLRKKFKTRLIFDMRGFWADERVEGGIWKLKNPLHKQAYKYFKRKEKQMADAADHIVTLTHRAKDIISGWSSKPVTVIPCCADTQHFHLPSGEEKRMTRSALGLHENDFVVGYLGSIGTWYMLEEMLDFFVELRKKKENAVFFFVTPDKEEIILTAARKKKIPAKAVKIRSARRNEVPHFISAFDLGVFFIRPTFSKQGSSPTKLAELLACGIPVVTNSGIGDSDAIIKKKACGILVDEFSSKAYQQAVEQAEKILSKSPSFFRDIALADFSLEKGVSAYEKIYNSLID